MNTDQQADNKKRGLAPVPRIGLRSKNAAQALEISESALHRLTKENAVPHVRVGGIVLYPVRELKKWLSKQAILRP